jgi:hypothetical protein
MPKTVFTNCQSTNLDQLIGDKGLRVFNNGGHEVGKVEIDFGLICLINKHTFG